ncbi:MAG: hypothetical protein ABII01_07030 [Candidatus Woesearchaeota archaeon]
MDAKNKKVIFFGILVILIPSIFYLNFLLSDNIPVRDMLTYGFARSEVLRHSFEEYNDYNPLWNPYFMSGTPYYAQAISFGFDQPIGYLLIFFNTVTALKLNFVIDIILAGLFMYLFMISIKLKPEYAFISAFVYMFNGYAIKYFYNTNLMTLNAYAFVPLAMLFAVMTLKSRKWLLLSIITGLIFAIQIRVGPDLKVFLFTFLIFLIYNAMILTLNLKNKWKMITINVIIVGLIIGGLSAQKILPEKEYLEMSSRVDLKYEESSGRKVPVSEFFSRLIEPVRVPKVHEFKTSEHIGIFAALLALLAIVFKFRNKITIFFLIVLIMSLLLASGSFLFYLLWKYIPPFDSFRYLERILSMFAFGASALAGIGAFVLFERILKKVNRNKKVGLYIFVFMLIFLDLAVFGYSPFNKINLDVYDAIESNDAINEIASKEGIYRMNFWETTGIDWDTQFYTVPLGIEGIYGYETAWYIPYFNYYLGYANENPSKLWGILNLKYITSMTELNISGFELVKKASDCDECKSDEPNINKGWGPYVYENKEVVPRAFLTEHAILLFGDKENIDKIMPRLLVGEEFNPRKTVLITKESDNKKLIENDLKKISGMIIAKSTLEESEINILREFHDKGGIVVPDIFNDENQITNEGIKKIFETDLDPVAIEDSDVITHDFDHKEIRLNDGEGKFLVLSEKYSIFPGWKATVNGKEKELLNADSMITAIFIDEPGDAIFSYMPQSYKTGRLITIITIILIIGVLVYLLFVKKEKKE